MMASPQIKGMLAKHPQLAAYMGTPPQAIERFLDALQGYGGAAAYLRHIGVSAAEIRAIETRLGQRHVAG